MAALLLSLLSGLLFGAGLTVSQMVNPAKVAAFLDVAGPWDPSLALVMGGALAVAAVSYRRVLRWQRPLQADTFHLPSSRKIEPGLIAGSAVFGVGWGLAGLCPGPALASLSYGTATLPFVCAMVGAMLAWEAWGALGLAGGSPSPARSVPQARPESV
jgi:uncharacterized protein